MNPDPPLPARLKAGSPGVGHASQADIEQRAAELAQTDGREVFTDADLTRAAADLAGGAVQVAAPEADPGVEALTAWDDPPQQTAQRIEPLPVEDEATIAERLIREGMEEAEHDIRVAAEKDGTAEKP